MWFSGVSYVGVPPLYMALPRRSPLYAMSRYGATFGVCIVIMFIYLFGISPRWDVIPIYNTLFWIVWSLTLFIVVISFLRYPRTYEIYSDAIRIRIRTGRVVCIPMCQIVNVSHISGMYCQGWSIRYITTWRCSDAVRIDTAGCYSYIISPEDPHEFVRQFHAVRSQQGNVAFVPNQIGTLQTPLLQPQPPTPYTPQTYPQPMYLPAQPQQQQVYQAYFQTQPAAPAYVQTSQKIQV